MRARWIESLDLPELEPYRTLKRPLAHREQQLFVVTNAKVVQRFLQSRFQVVSLLLTQEWLEQLRPLLEQRPEEEIPAFLGDKKLLETISGYSMHQGVLAVGRIPEQPTLAAVLAARPAPRLLAAVDGLNSAENLGALIRNCAAFGVHALLIGETTCDPFLRRSVSSSMGGIFQVPMIQSSNLAQTILDLRAQGIRCVAAHPHATGASLPDTCFPRDCLVVFGNEGDGISARVLSACDAAVAVPMPPAVDSLNVVSAAAVFLYEINRQRGKLGRPGAPELNSTRDGIETS